MPRIRLRSIRTRRGGFDFKKELGGYTPPSFPALITKALDLLADPDVDMAELSNTLELDPGVTARLLGIVNSAAVAPRSKVTSVNQAAVLLGRNQLEAVLISAGTRSAIPRTTGPNYDHNRFWTTAAKRAALASAISDHVDPTRRSENFTAALLQDMAIPVLTEHVPPYNSVLEHWHNGTEDLATLEDRVFGWHHGDVASWMGETWGFPDDFVAFMRDHHDVVANHLLPAYLVSPIREVGAGGDAEVIETTGSELGLGTDVILAMIATAESQAAELAKLVS